MTRTLVSLALLPLLTGCTLLSEENEPPSSHETAAPPFTGRLKVYLSRGSLTNTDFEQYAVTNATLYAECGTVIRGRFKPTDTAIGKLAEEQLLALGSLAVSLSPLFDPAGGALPPPGESVGVFDPGMVELTTASGRVATSLDAVADIDDSRLRPLKALVEQLRALVPEPLCGNTDFYGLSRKKT